MADAGGPVPGRGRRRRPGGTVLGSRPAYSVRLPPRARPAPAVTKAERTVPWLRVAAAYAWRIVLVGIAVHGAFTVLGRFQLIAVAVFLALVVTAVLRPAADLLHRFLPRPLGVAVALVGSLLVLLALLALVGNTVAGQWAKLASEFGGGLHRIEQWLGRPPFRIGPGTLTGLWNQALSYLSTHRAGLLDTLLSGLGRLVELVTAGALALFLSVFFIHSGERDSGGGPATSCCPAGPGRCGSARGGRPGGPSPDTPAASSSWPPSTPSSSVSPCWCCASRSHCR